MSRKKEKHAHVRQHTDMQTEQKNAQHGSLLPFSNIILTYPAAAVKGIMVKRSISGGFHEV